MKLQVINFYFREIRDISNLDVSFYLCILHLCKIRGSHGDDYEEWRLLGCYTVWLL
jgi:hypothetical protein